MPKANWAELYRIVLAELDRVTTTKRGGRKRIWNAIYAAHNGRPDGFLVNTDNMGLFRQYRNNVSPNPDHLIDAALAYQKEDSHAVPPM
jgi:hypothetical protein